MLEVDKRVKDILVELLFLDTEPNDEDNIYNDLVLDSIDAVEIIMGCEKEFGIVIPDEESEIIKTVSDIISVVKKHTGEE